MKITNLHARQILDSKSTPTIEVEVELEDGTKALAGVPSGASTGDNEAVELRDGDSSQYEGKGVTKAVSNINGPLNEIVKNVSAYDQRKLDRTLIDADGTHNKSKYGGNAIVGISMAVCRAAALSQKIPLYRYFGQLSNNTKFSLPQPMILILEGGKHGNWATDIQEFMIVPKIEKFPKFTDSIRAGSEIFHALEKILKEKNYSTGVGFEGAFSPKELSSNEESFELLTQAVQRANYQLGEEIVLAIDMGATEFYQDDHYVLHSEGDKKISAQDWKQQVIKWSQQFPLWSIEDPFDQEAWSSWTELMSEIGEGVQLVGDDLVTTNVNRIQKAIDQKSINSVLIKPNQIGTISETLDAIALSDQAGFTTVISHRSGETNDDMIADLVVGTSSEQCKFGGPDRGERLAKYNRLLRIEEELGQQT